MCILMYFGPDAMPIRTHLDTGCENNPDGFGWAIVTQTEGILTGHGMDADAVIEEFMATREVYPQHSALFHARIATQGSVCLDNCHPFTVGHRILRASKSASVQGEMVLGHNGMLPVYPGKGDDRSDTKLFAEEIFMRRFPHLDSDKTRRRLEAYLGGSKLVILTTDPAYKAQSYIFNARLGEWIDHEGDGDIWYSNSSYCRRRYASWSWTSSRTNAVDIWNNDRETDFNYRLACEHCKYALVYCRCIGIIKGTYLPWDEVKVPTGSEVFTPRSAPAEPEEKDESAEWTCLTCECVGSIDDDGQCRECGTRFCCDMPRLDCFCWDPITGRLRTAEEIEKARERYQKMISQTIDALSDL